MIVTAVLRRCHRGRRSFYSRVGSNGLPLRGIVRVRRIGCHVYILRAFRSFYGATPVAASGGTVNCRCRLISTCIHFILGREGFNTEASTSNTGGHRATCTSLRGITLSNGGHFSDFIPNGSGRCGRTVDGCVGAVLPI